MNRLFSEPIEFHRIDNEQIDQYIEPNERSLKRYDENFTIRHSILFCLLNALPYPSSKKDLIELSIKENLTSSKIIEEFKNTYSAEKAIFFYTKYEFIYGTLNSALRTTNIRHLFAFRFIIQDICHEMCQLMSQKSDDHAVIVYRCQRGDSYEIADLISAHKNGSFVTITSFFSTSKSRDCAMDFLRATGAKLCDSKSLPILFKITINKEDVSPFLPIAEISQISNFPEEQEVLLAPGQCFSIDRHDIIFEQDINVFVFEMTLKKRFNESIASIYNELEQKWSSEMNSSSLNIGTLLLQDKRLNEAKEYFMQLLSNTYDKNTSYVCYQSLFSIASKTNNTDEAMRMLEKMNEIKRDPTTSSTHRDNLRFTQEDFISMKEISEQTMNIVSLMSHGRSMHEILTNMRNGTFRAQFQQLNEKIYKFTSILMKNNMYELAIHHIEPVLYLNQTLALAALEPLLNVKYNIRLGYCYRKLKSNNEALKYYKLALEQIVDSVSDDYIEATIGMAQTLESMNSYEEALNNYIEVATIYNNNSTIGSPEERHEIEKSIERVLSYFIT